MTAEEVHSNSFPINLAGFSAAIKIPSVDKGAFPSMNSRLQQVIDTFPAFLTNQLVLTYSKEKFESFYLGKTDTRSYAICYPLS